MKVYRGAASAARAYVEADRSRVDDYYLAEGTGLAERFTATPVGGVVREGVLDGDGYEAWVAGLDPVTAEARGRLRLDGSAVRFVEITVNGPKTWSLAAALDPAVAAAYDAAQDRAAHQIIAWVAEHATTRVGPRGRQVQVPVERIEAVTVRHYTSRAGDPHRHLHLQVNARVFADGAWRGLHTVGFRDSIEALNGIGHAAVMTDPGFRTALAAAGFTLDPSSGELAELAPYVGGFSERGAQIGRNIDRYEADWRTANPGQEPGLVVWRSWDRRAWKDARPDKIIPTDGAALLAHWRQQMRDLGYRGPGRQLGLSLAIIHAPSVGGVDRGKAVKTILTRLGTRRSAWNAADVRGEAEKQVAASGLVVDAAVRTELAEDLTARAVDACVPLLDLPGVPDHVRCLTSAQVLAVEASIVARLASRAEASATPALPPVEGLDDAQQVAVAVLAGQAGLIVVEGAAGAGKTTTLAAAKTAVETAGHRMLVVTPTLKAAQVAAREVGRSGSVAWLVHQHGFRWDHDGRWTRQAATPAPEAKLAPGDLLLVDEAGMLDQDTAGALLTVADEMGTRVALMGDRHQLPAVGRGGVLDLAASWVTPQAHVDLDMVHRFADPEYAAITLALRTGTATYSVPGEARGEGKGERVGVVWDALRRRDQVHVYPSGAERTQTLAGLAAAAFLTGHRDTGTVMMADTREQVIGLNAAIRDRLVAAGHVDDINSTVTTAGERIGLGDRVTTRLNDRHLGVTNRATWTVTGVRTDGSLTLRGRRLTDLQTVPCAYVRDHVELAYATTVYGAQGETASTGHLVLGEHTSAASAYVAMTRGRHDNVIHIVADDIDDARCQWDDAFGRDRADLGPTVAATRAAQDVDRHGSQTPKRGLQEVLAELRAAWTQQADLNEQQQRLIGERDALQQVVSIRARFAPDQQRLRAEVSSGEQTWRDTHRRVTHLEATLDTEAADLQTRIWAAWHQDLSQAQRAARVIDHGAGRFGQRRRQVDVAKDELTAFTERWRPVHPDLPTVPVELATPVKWLYGRRVEEQIDAYVTHQVTEAHPDADHDRRAERVARATFEAAEKALTQLEGTLCEQLRPYGYAAHVTEPGQRLTAVTDQLATAEHDLRTATTRVYRLQGQPAARALPSSGLDAEHRQWAADRTAGRETADREAELRQMRHRPSNRIGPSRPGHYPALDHRTPGIGR